MIKRHLYPLCFDNAIGRQMRFIAGPRQVGKTTLAKTYLKNRHFEKGYFNWDLLLTRNLHKKDHYFFESWLYENKNPAWLCFDEIHKMPKWKNLLKDYFDRFEQKARFIITGSAKLDMFRKSGDSLAGRYFLFNLLPLSLSEVCAHPPKILDNSQNAQAFLQSQVDKLKYNQAAFEQLLNLSGFPEPFLKAKANFHRKWQQNLIDRIIREDLRDLTRIIDLENIATLTHILPERIGSPLSYNALKQNLEVSYNAIKNYMRALKLVYVIFFIEPFSGGISRSVKKEKKFYFYDWSKCTDAAKRFENYVAVELKTMTELWNDQAAAGFDLCFVRTKDGKESDFLIVKDKKPWLLCEAKLSQSKVAPHHHKHAQRLGNIPFVQIVQENKVVKKISKSSYQISAGRFFG